jgi:hypothetical protein
LSAHSHSESSGPNVATRRKDTEKGHEERTRRKTDGPATPTYLQRTFQLLRKAAPLGTPAENAPIDARAHCKCGIECVIVRSIVMRCEWRGECAIAVC